jgi:integrase
MPRKRTRTRRYGEGSVREDRSRPGVWRAELWDADPAKRFRVRVDSEDEAHAALDRELQRRRESRTDGDDVLLGALVDEYRDEVVATMTPATAASYRWALDQLGPSMRAKRLCDLRVDDVKRELARLARRPAGKRTSKGGTTGPLGVSSLRRVRAVLGAVLDDAVARDLVARNVARAARLPADAAPTGEKIALTREQAADLERAAAEHPMHALVVIALRYGLRPGELLGLPWRAVDLDDGLLTVRQSLTRQPDSSLVIGPTKSHSDRVLRLAGDHVELLRAHQRRQAADQLAARSAWDERRLGLVFCNEIGGPLDPSNLRRIVAELCKAANVPAISPNELRHTCASLLIDAGMPPQQVADLLGHRDVTMLAKHYRHRVARVVDVTDTLARVVDVEPPEAPTPIRQGRRAAGAATATR